MKAELLKKEGNVVTLKIAVDYDKFNGAVEKAYKKTRGRYNIPGFRKGKAPRKIIEMNYGEGIFYGDAIDAIFPEVFEVAIKETEISPIAAPSIDVDEISKDNGLVMSVEVEVRPEVKLGQYKGVEVKKDVPEVTEEMVTEELNRMLENNSRLVDVERNVENGDIVNIDFKGFVDGVEFEGGNAEGYELTIGSNTFIDNFEEQLTGKSLNEEVEVNVTFPEEYSRTDLAGKPAKFEVKINAIKVKEVPELNDEFVSDTTEFETVEELKADIKAKLEEEAKNFAESQIRNEIVNKIAEEADFETPNSMVEEQLNRMMNELAFQLQSQGLQMEQLLEITGKNLDGLKEERREDAIQLVRGSLVLEEVGKLENIEATEEEVDAEVAKMAEMYKMEAAEVKKVLRPEDLEDIAGQVKVRKTIDFLVENATIA
ncbi:trigger factor [Peptacetobacter sp.]|uniref:trigger factor n=1 Tax=Peptacetobacter sp. TaxID=2991975 RepID=UPI00262024CB|nr:trigger factor [Peptacetobacter sp.]